MRVQQERRTGRVRVMLLFVAVACCAGIQAQPQPHLCAISGQSADAALFDLSQVEFVSEPLPILVGHRGLSFQTISRVVGLQPMVFETLDVSLDDRTSTTMCERMRIYSVDARLRDILPQLRFNDLVKTTMVLAEGGRTKLILSRLEKISPAPAYFHGRAGDSVCPNRTGTLAAYTKPSGETIIVHNDGAISYEDAHLNEFVRERLDAEGMTRLLQAFQSAGFNALGSQMPPIDDTRSQASITLICARHQQVPAPGHEAALAPLMRIMDEAKLKALAQTHYLLTYAERREATFLEWPFAQAPLEKMEALEEAADREVTQACKEKREPHGPAYDMLHQPVPTAFLAKLPRAFFLVGARDEPHPYVYVKAGKRVFRVEKPPGADQPRASDSTYDFLEVHETREPEVALARLAAKVKEPSTCCGGPPAPPPPSSATATEREAFCSLLMGIHGGVLWPADLGIELRRIPAGGQAVSQAEYSKHERVYRELLAAGVCGSGWGVDFLEGAYVYIGIRLTRVEGEKR